jgi:thiosulfate dehydrogenase
MLLWTGFPSSPAASAAPATAQHAAAAPFPSGLEGKLIAYGHEIVTNTRQVMPKNVTADMSCEACHLDAGRKAHGGSFVGIAAKFPQWNKRSHRFITLQDRLAECFLYSMNGTPPAYDSREMIALDAYITFLSRGAVIGKGFTGQGFANITPDHTPSIAAGRAVYAQSCVACHGANGQGTNGAFPPLWGAASFNGGAGMHRLTTMAAFVRYNMPYGSAANTLSRQQAYDVSAYVLSHPRPKFNGTRLITFTPHAADKY